MTNETANPNGGASRPLRMSERLTIVLSARLDLAIDAVRDDTDRPARLMTVNACTAKMVLIALVDFHGQDGRMYPGLDTLATMACTSWDTVDRVVKLLEYLKVLTVTRRSMLKGQALQDRTNWYVINWERLISLADSKQVADCDPIPSSMSGSQIATCSASTREGERVADCDLIKHGQQKPSGSQTAPEQVADCVPHQVADCVPKPLIINRSVEPLRHASPGEGSIGSDDDASEPGHAPLVFGEERLKRELEQGGIHGGRARKLARRMITLGEDVAEGILREATDRSRSAGSKRRAPGAYLASLIEDALSVQAETDAKRADQQIIDRLRDIDDANATIDGMSDDAIAAHAARSAVLRQIPAATIRKDKAFRRELARLLAVQASAQPQPTADSNIEARRSA